MKTLEQIKAERLETLGKVINLPPDITREQYQEMCDDVGVSTTNIIFKE